MRVSEKGQVTIPIAIRRELGIMPDSEVDIEVVGDTVVIHKSDECGRRGEALVRRLRGRATVAMSTDAILALTRGGER